MSLYYLRNVWTSISGLFRAHQNFEDIEARLYFLRPSSATIIGPPTTAPTRGGVWLQDELWIDAARNVWRCVIPGTPGQWTKLYPFSPGQLNVSIDELIGILEAHIGAGGSTNHPDATTSVSGFMSTADKTKLDAIPPGGGSSSADLKLFSHWNFS